MATITTPTYLDDGTARTGGEAWTINGGVLTVRTDTRWHIGNSAMGATTAGTLGTCTISSSLGGGIVYDGTKVRWMAYTGGSGNAPAIGTTITQGVVSGYLLGVWASVASAPTTVGAAIPATGFLKFREVTNGPFAAGALTGITATAASADVTGWIEIVADQVAKMVVPRLGYHNSIGDWFYLGTTTGAAQQVVQTPNFGGGAATVVPGLWIETAVAGVYEWYSSTYAAAYIAANLGTDTRSKFVYQNGTGQLIIGGDGTNAIGYVPPAGRKIRIPNIILHQTVATTRTTNAAPSTTLANRPTWTTTSSGAINLTYLYGDWYPLFSGAYSITLANSNLMDYLNIINCASAINLSWFGHGSVVNGGGNGLNISACLAGGTITDCNFHRPVTASSHVVTVAATNNLTLTRVTSGNIGYVRTANSYAFQCSLCTYISMIDCKQIGVGTLVTSCSYCTVDGLDHTDRYVGVANSTTPIFAVFCYFGASNNLVKNIKVGLGGTIADNAPYAGLFQATSAINCTFRSVGTFTTPLVVATSATNAPAVIYVDGGNNSGIRVQHCYINYARSGTATTANTSSDLLVENTLVQIGSASSSALNARMRSVRSASVNVTGLAAVYGSHWVDGFTSDTAGYISVTFNEPTTASASQCTIVQLGAGSGFTSAGNLVMANLNDEVILSLPYFALSHTALANIAPVITGTNTGNHTFYFDIDLGSGYSGSWTLATQANLAAITTINPATGFRMKLRVVCNTASASNLLTNWYATTTSTLAAQTNYSYALDYATINLSGYQLGSRIQIYDTTNSVELYNGVPSTSTFSYSAPYVSDINVRIRVMYCTSTTAKLFYEYSQLMGISGLSKTIVQVDDLVYIANAVNGSTVTGITIADGLMRIQTTLGTYSWPQIYAYEKYWLSTAAGIIDVGSVITAVNTANYAVDTFKIKNASSGPSVPLVISGYGYSASTGLAIDIIDTSGGTIFQVPQQVIPYSSVDTSTVTAGLTAQGYTTTRATKLDNLGLIPALL